MWQFLLIEILIELLFSAGLSEESAVWHPVTLEHFEKSKMASKMAAKYFKLTPDLIYDLPKYKKLTKITGINNLF